MVASEEKPQETQPPEGVENQPLMANHLEDRESDICPGCGSRLDFWACEALCHNCGLKFTCDE